MKQLLENNKIVVEKNLEKSQLEANLKELNLIYRDVTLNKAFTSKYQVILDLISIPFILITLLKQNNLELFVEYVKFVEGLMEYKVMEVIKHTVSVIKSIAQRYLLNNLQLGNNIYDSVIINEIINIPVYEYGDDNLNIQIHIYYLFKQEYKTVKIQEPKDYVNNLLKNIIKYFNDIVKTLTLCETKLDEKEKLLITIIDNHIV